MNIPDFKSLLSHQYKMLIDGELCEASDQGSLSSMNPATGEVLTRFPDATESDIEKAVLGATAAQSDWAELAVADRQYYLTQIADILRENSAELGALDSLENGNVYSHMQHDASGGAFMLDYFCNIANELKGESTQLDNNLHYTRHEPFGVVAKLFPFNHPIQSLASGIGAPLLTGNTMIVKPSPHTSLSALKFGELVKNVLPRGVLNVVTGRNERVAATLLSHPGIPRVSATGSTEVGRLALRLGAENLKTTTLELGGKTPMIVFPDADLEKSVDAAVRGMNFKWQGHSCSSTSRVLVHESLHDRFVEHLAARFRSVNVALPFDAESEMGPISHEDQFNKIIAYIESGKAEGATLVCGGERLVEGELSRGFFISPAIFSGVTASMKIAREEIYGPVISIISWSEEEEAIDIANSVDYGLAAVIMSNDIHRVHTTARKLKCGYVEVNGPVSFALGSPFGGTKYSGTGREGNLQELLSYTQLKSVNVQL